MLWLQSICDTIFAPKQANRPPTPTRDEQERCLPLSSHVEYEDNVQKQLDSFGHHDEECREVEVVKQRSDDSAHEL